MSDLSTLAQRMREAAKVVAEASRYFDGDPDGLWTATELRVKADQLDASKAMPDYAGCAGACADLGDDQ